VAGGVVLTIAAAAAEPPPGPIERFNFVLGTQTFGASYHFTGEAPVVETARAITALGSNTIKFKLEPSSGGEPTLTEIARSDPVIKAVIDMPFVNELIWVYPLATKARLFDPATLGTEYRELYDVTRYLLQTYAGTGKVFFLGNWEMDNHLTASRKREPSPELLENVTAWVNTRQQAVDDAKHDTPHSDVEAFYYLEVNLVWTPCSASHAPQTPCCRRPMSIMFRIRLTTRCFPTRSKNCRRRSITSRPSSDRNLVCPESGCSSVSTDFPP
jgi:hypothetical protein